MTPGSLTSADCTSVWIFVAQSGIGTFTIVSLQPLHFANSCFIAFSIPFAIGTSFDVTTTAFALPPESTIVQSASSRAAWLNCTRTSAVTFGGIGSDSSKKCVTSTGMPAFFAAIELRLEHARVGRALEHDQVGLLGDRPGSRRPPTATAAPGSCRSSS